MYGERKMETNGRDGEEDQDDSGDRIIRMIFAKLWLNNKKIIVGCIFFLFLSRNTL